jgi:hypothetical protein
MALQLRQRDHGRTPFAVLVQKTQLSAALRICHRLISEMIRRRTFPEK